jgi:hypothetical protein
MNHEVSHTPYLTKRTSHLLDHYHTATASLTLVSQELALVQSPKPQSDQCATADGPDEEGQR